MGRGRGHRRTVTSPASHPASPHIPQRASLAESNELTSPSGGSCGCCRQFPRLRDVDGARPASGDRTVSLGETGFREVGEGARGDEEVRYAFAGDGPMALTSPSLDRRRAEHDRRGHDQRSPLSQCCRLLARPVRETKGRPGPPVAPPSARGRRLSFESRKAEVAAPPPLLASASDPPRSAPGRHRSKGA
jgi:hypothetical protein